MVEGCSPEDRGYTSKVDGPESLAISICDVSYKLMNLKIILFLIHCLLDMPTRQARLSCYVREMSHCPRGVRRQMSYSNYVTGRICIVTMNVPINVLSRNNRSSYLLHYCNIFFILLAANPRSAPRDLNLDMMLRNKVAMLIVIVSVGLLTSASISKVIEFEAEQGTSNGDLRTRLDGKKNVYLMMNQYITNNFMVNSSCLVNVSNVVYSSDGIKR